MTFSYDPSLTEALDRVRFRLGDTIEGDALHQDEEIEYHLVAQGLSEDVTVGRLARALRGDRGEMEASIASQNTSAKDVAVLYEATLSAAVSNLPIEWGDAPDGAWGIILEILIGSLTEGRSATIFLASGAVRRYEEHVSGVASPQDMGIGTTTHILPISQLNATNNINFYGVAGSCFVRIRRIGWL